MVGILLLPSRRSASLSIFCRGFGRRSINRYNHRSKALSIRRPCMGNPYKSTLMATIDKISHLVNQEKYTGASRCVSIIRPAADRNAYRNLMNEAYPDSFYGRYSRLRNSPLRMQRLEIQQADSSRWQSGHLFPPTSRSNGSEI
jgi:hypothetical protein